MLTSESVARHLLHLASFGDEPVPLTHMQLQKLAYYAQGWSLALRSAPLFTSRIEAWEHGPVVKDLYTVFSGYRSRPIDPTERKQAESATESEFALLDSIWGGYGRYSASYLRELTHAEDPWLNARRGVPDGSRSANEITHESMRTFFRSLDSRACARFGITRESLEQALASSRTSPCVPWDDFKRDMKRAVAD